jgi:hypothetical protein
MDQVGKQPINAQRIMSDMQMLLSWMTNIWNQFGLWVSAQPTFVEVAIGVALFYVSLQIFRLIWQALNFLLGGLFAGRSRPLKQPKITVARPHSQGARTTADDEAPPFVFR